MLHHACVLNDITKEFSNLYGGHRRWAKFLHRLGLLRTGAQVLGGVRTLVGITVSQCARTQNFKHPATAAWELQQRGSTHPAPALLRARYSSVGAHTPCPHTHPCSHAAASRITAARATPQRGGNAGNAVTWGERGQRGNAEHQNLRIF